MSAALIRSLLAIAMMSSAALPVPAAQPGVQAPAFSLPRLGGGEPVQLEQFRGSVVLVDFWASWCSTCLHSMPAYDKLMARFAGRDFTVIAISVDENEADAQHFIALHPVHFITLIDSGGTIAERFGLKGMPTSYLIGGDGRVRDINLGYEPDDFDMLAGEIERLLEEDRDAPAPR